MGTTWSKMIYIYLLLYNTRVHRDEWIYITSKWSSLPLCYAFNMISLVHIALAALFQYHLHFSMHTLSSCCGVFCFYPSGCPTYENNTLYSQGNIALEFCSTNHWLHCYLLITSLFYVWNHSTMGLQVEKANYLRNVHLLSWGGQVFFLFPPLFPLCVLPLLGDRKRVSAAEVRFGYLFIDFPFNIHAFLRTIWVRRRICCLGGGRGQKIRLQSQWAPWIKEGEGDGEIEREQECWDSCVLS